MIAVINRSSISDGNGDAVVVGTVGKIDLSNDGHVALQFMHGVGMIDG